MRSLVVAVALLLVPTALTATADQRPAWISGCTAWKNWGSTTKYSAHCTSGSNRYWARAVCYKWPSQTQYDLGSYVWPGTTSTGTCPSGWSVGSVKAIQ